MRKRAKAGIGMGSCVCLCAALVATAIAGPPNDVGNFMLNKYSPNQEVDYQTDGLVMMDSRVCIHGDKSALDIQYAGVLEKTIKQAESDTAVKSSSEIEFWVCQSEVLDD